MSDSPPPPPMSFQCSSAQALKARAQLLVESVKLANLNLTNKKRRQPHLQVDNLSSNKGNDKQGNLKSRKTATKNEANEDDVEESDKTV